MKKYLTFYSMIVAVLLLGSFYSPQTANADSHLFMYTLKGDGTMEILSYQGSSKDIVIPETYNGRKVTSIQPRAFEGKNLRSAVIPSSIKTIGADAFKASASTFKILGDMNTAALDYALENGIPFYEKKWVEKQNSANYSDSSGFTGTLERYVESGTYVPPRTVYVENHPTPTYTFEDGYKATIQYLPLGEGIEHVTGGLRYMIFALSNGEIYGMGRNNLGQLGDGTDTERLVPTKMKAPWGKKGIKQVVGGNSHTVILLETGEVYATGSNLAGQLGDGTTTDRLEPVKMKAPWGNTKVKQVDAGYNYTMILLENGEVYATGQNNYGGKLGDGTEEDQSTPVKVKTPWGSSKKVEQISVGRHHTVFLLDSGEIYTNGRNETGVLGDGTTENRGVPVKSQTPWGNSKKVEKISAGNNTLYLLNTGEVYAVGSNARGQIGDGTTTDRSKPVKVHNSWGNKKIVDVASTNNTAVFNHNLFLTEDGDVYGVGDNTAGQLGIDSSGTGNIQLLPVKMVNSWGNAKVEKIIAIYARSFVIVDSGVYLRTTEAWATGANGEGQLGDGTIVNKQKPVKTTFEAKEVFTGYATRPAIDTRVYKYRGYAGRLVVNIGQWKVSGYEVFGDKYFGGQDKFFENTPIDIAIELTFESKVSYARSGPVGFLMDIDGKSIDRQFNNINLKPGESHTFYLSDFTKDTIRAKDISGKNFKEEDGNVNFLAIGTEAVKGTAAANKYTSVNKVYDAAIKIVNHNPEDPVPGEKARTTLELCNNGNQAHGSFVDVLYNGEYNAGGVYNLAAGTYANNGVVPKCMDITLDTLMPELIDSNEMYDMEARITMGPIEQELSASNNTDTKRLDQGVGAEPIYICNTNGDWLETIYDMKDKTKNGSPDNCKSEDGTGDPGPDLTEPSEEQVSIVEPKPGYVYPKNPVNTGVPIAKAISGKDFKEENETIFVEVNPDNKHPDDDTNKNNDTRKKQYKSVNKVYDVRVKDVAKIVPAVPKSNEAVKVHVQVCNDGNQHILDYSAQVLYENENRNSGTVNGLDIQRGPYTNIKSDPNCKEIVINTTMFDIENMEDDFDSWVKLYPTLPSGEADNKPANNTLKFDTKVENPNAYIYIRNTGSGDQNIISETGGVSLVVQNNMFRTIKDNCGSDCEHSSGHTNSKAFIKIKDKTNKENLTVPALKFDLDHTESQVVRLDNIIKNYIDGLSTKDYQVVEFEIEAQIPHYKGEVDYSGQPSYADNTVKTNVHYFPPRPNVSLMECNVLEGPSGYFQINGVGPDGPVKSCAGHYPNNPSTQIEEGMQAYHFLMYRFLPTPIPKYEITSPAGSDETDPAFFNQIFELEEKITEKGDEETMFFSNKDANGIYKERGRYLPTGASFDFKVEESRDGGDVIAAGKITYNIPPNCYEEKSLTLKNQYGCDEIMLFVPNSDDGRKFDTPEDFDTTNNKVVYPLGKEGKATTKIPYLNPGIFEFSLDVEEYYHYYYQENRAVENDYYWSDVKKK